ncbi:MAG: FkbM family methyltransferase [Candidatus Saganbacteria bacterium]|nr:FkbM family methyltransferase [Candidatus Saganbacteria bacterium]
MTAKTIEELILKFPSMLEQHVPSSEAYALLKKSARGEIEKIFSDQSETPKAFLPFGNLIFPYHKMGAVDSLNLFDIDELIIFSFYWANRKRYKKVADIGANIGLHSIVLSKCGFEVRCFEPDPRHFEILSRNLKLNHCNKVQPFNMAVSSKPGEMEFIRVLGNTTGSHLAGSKKDPYGALDKFAVKVEGFTSIVEWADLIKLDAEGHEKEIISVTTREQWLHTDAMVGVQ